MAYALYGRQVFRAEVNGKKFIFTCYGQGTAYGFRHICCEGFSNTTVARYVKGDIIAKACYYNRTWERFTYETVLKRGIENLNEPKEVKEELHAILIDGKAQAEHEATEKFLKDFEQAWNGLSEKNKEHIRNGIGDTGITTQEQADTVLFATKMLKVVQDMEGNND